MLHSTVTIPLHSGPGSKEWAPLPSPDFRIGPARLWRLSELVCARQLVAQLKRGRPSLTFCQCCPNCGPRVCAQAHCCREEPRSSLEWRGFHLRRIECPTQKRRSCELHGSDW